MPRHYPAELRRQTCERMLAGEAVSQDTSGLPPREWRELAASLGLRNG